MKACHAYAKAAPPASANRWSPLQPADRDQRETRAIMTTYRNAYTPTVDHPHCRGVTRKIEPAASAAAPASHGLGANPSLGPSSTCRRGSRKEATTTPAK